MFFSIPKRLKWTLLFRMDSFPEERLFFFHIKLQLISYEIRIQLIPNKTFYRILYEQSQAVAYDVPK